MAVLVSIYKLLCHSPFDQEIVTLTCPLLIQHIHVHIASQEEKQEKKTSTVF